MHTVKKAQVDFRPTLPRSPRRLTAVVWVSQDGFMQERVSFTQHIVNESVLHLAASCDYDLALVEVAGQCFPSCGIGRQ